MAINVREDNIKEMQEIKTSIEAKVKQYNELLQNDGKAEEVSKLDTDIAEAVKKYTSCARTVCFEDCKNSGTPMMSAIKRLTFDTIAIKDTKTAEDKVPVRSVEPKAMAIDLLKLDAYCNGIGEDKKWSHIAQKLNCLLTARTCKELGVDPKKVNDSYAMSAIAKEIDLGETPTSNTQILKAMNTVIAAMVGEQYKATSHDVAYLLMIYTKKSKKALRVACSDHKKFVALIAEIVHRIVMNKTYDVEFPQKKGS